MPYCAQLRLDKTGKIVYKQRTSTVRSASVSNRNLNKEIEMASDEIKAIWGAKEIAKTIGRPVRATFRLLESGKIPAKKIGGRWAVTKETLDRFFAEVSMEIPARS